MNITKIYNLEKTNSALLKEYNEKIIKLLKDKIVPMYRERFLSNAQLHLDKAVQILMHPFNQKYLEFSTLYDSDLSFLISYLVRQSDKCLSEIKCDLLSDHGILMPRINNDIMYLVCPICGYIKLL